MARKPLTHEDFSREDTVKVGSEKGFGIVFAVVFAIIGLWPLIDGAPVRLWSLVVAGVFLILAFLLPQTLRPLNLVWFRFGLLLHKIVNPLVMGFLFFSTVLPIAIILRMVDKDPLHRKFDSAAETYWIQRDPPGPEPDSMRHQF